MVGNVHRLSSATAKWDRGCTKRGCQYSRYPGVHHRRDICLLGHLLLLFFPLTRLQIEERVDLLLLGLRIGKLQHIVVDRLASPRRGSTDGWFGPRRIPGIHGHFSGDITSCTAFTGTSCRQATGDDRGRSRDDGGIVIIF